MNAIKSIWHSMLGRVVIIGGIVGVVPFYLLATAHAALVNR